MSLRLKFKDKELELKQVEPSRYEVVLERQSDIVDFAKALIDGTEGEVYLMSINAIDYPDKGVIELRYLFWSLKHKSIIDARTRVPRDKPIAESLIEVVPGAKPYEQEIYDLFGVVFRGNKWLRDGFFKPPDMGAMKPLLKQAPPSRKG